MLGKDHSAVPEYLCPIYRGVHQDVMTLGEMMAVAPCEDLILREHPAEMNDLLFLLSVLLINIVADEKIQFFTAHDQLFEFPENLGIGTFLNPVIRINKSNYISFCLA